MRRKKTRPGEIPNVRWPEPEPAESPGSMIVEPRSEPSRPRLVIVASLEDAAAVFRALAEQRGERDV